MIGYDDVETVTDCHIYLIGYDDVETVTDYSYLGDRI